ncbi:MAG: helix-turn-helix transcriptional regulator [Silvibacterium sp.]|nr:helix-turn-helix transcriptional regulator [Silvibacterium sp.]MBV8438809.1 helix-turn-helix transcriptional regulator [Silvibacterium sp.]
MGKTKHQVRTEETQARILDAAEAVFSEQGFDKTQLEEVAARAGYTRGAIYAHYASKEDLFLALMEQRVLTKLNRMRQVIEAEPLMSKRPGIFREWIAAQAGDHTWGTLMLEFKLYALRRPESREKLLHMYDLMTKASGKDFVESLFGANLDKAARAAAERRLVILGALLSAVNLESLFRPKLMSKQHVQPVLDELFGALIHA